MNILDNLNPRQKEAVLCTEGPLLILAGAGSGKTRTIIHRIAYILTEGLAYPWEILSLTFTNKAAGEMKERIDSMGVASSRDIWMGTFHSICARILRMDAGRLGFTQNFSIYDEDDSKRLIKNIMKSMDISRTEFPESFFKSSISFLKNNLVTKEEFMDTYEEYGDRYTQRMIAEVYSMYQSELLKSNAMDFDDLILNVNILFDQFPNVLEKYQRRFRYILVDEYQDTNMPQYEVVSKLARKHNNICVCGDDDQSIYEWRGATIRNILEFTSDFKDATVIRLEQNYRCTKYILDAANHVIENNEGRMGKTLFTDNEQGDKIIYNNFLSDLDEASYIAREIYSMCEYNGVPYKDVAVLYRTHSQSRIIEESLMRRSIPYQIVAGTKFYDRMEVKDILAYLKLIVNPKDDGAFLRIINTPRRGIGPATILKLSDYAELKGKSLFETVLDIDSSPVFKGSILSKLTSFRDSMVNIINFAEGSPLTELIKYTIEESGYDHMLREGRVENSSMRIDNLNELVNAAGDFEKFEDEPSLEAFLENASLVAGADSYDENQERVLLMTLHNAKGLEFDNIFIPGMEERLFPSYQSAEDLSRLEEERRLCYVGITRAKKKLFLSSASRRMVFGRREPREPSRFLDEIPSSCMEQDEFLEDRREEKRRSREYVDSIYSPYKKKTVIKSDTPSLSTDESFKAGDKVSHKLWGKGTIINAEKSGNDYRLTVAFPNQGIKTISAAVSGVKKV